MEIANLEGTCLGEDPVGLALNACLDMVVALRKENRKFKLRSSGVALILGGGGDEYYSNSDLYQVDGQTGFMLNDRADPLISDFIDVKVMLTGLKSIYALDSIAFLSPFLRVLKEKSNVEPLRTLALESIKRFYTFQLINKNCINYVQCYRETVAVLLQLITDIAGYQTFDDETEIETITVLQHIISLPCGDCLTDILIYEVLKRILLIVCRRKASQHLKRRAEEVLTSITIHIYGKLKFMNLTAINDKYIDDEQIKKFFVFKRSNNSSEFDLTEEIVNNESQESLSSENVMDTPNYGLPVIINYLTLLLSLISLDNKTEYTTHTQILGLKLINIIVELVGRLFLKHPKLLNMISDSIFKCVLSIIDTNDEKTLLIEHALRLFTTIVLSIAWFIPRQIELTLNSLLKKLKRSEFPELSLIIIEQLSVLWMRKPSIFIDFFIKFDCDLDFEDVSINFLKVMCTLAAPESNINVSTFALDGMITFINAIHTQIEGLDKLQLEHAPPNKVLMNRNRKTEFIDCIEKFNENSKEGIELLIENKFIPHNNEDEIAKFLFANNGRMNKKQLGLLICKPTNVSLLDKFMSNFDFRGLKIDEALRVLLTRFRLPGESQQIERIIESFSKYYVEGQKYDEYLPHHNDVANIEHSAVRPDSDSIFVLSYSIIMLNTDLHNPQIKEHMSFDEYSSNLRGSYNKGADYPKSFLNKIYCSIKDKEIVMPEEHHGNDTWFDDVWNNLISSTTVVTEVPKFHTDDLLHFTSYEIAQFESVLFKQVGSSIISKLFNMLETANEDDTIVALIGIIERCFKLTQFFADRDLFNEIVQNLGKQTLLMKPCRAGEENGNMNEDIIDYDNDKNKEASLIDAIDEETGEISPVSFVSVTVGRSFKAQMCLVLYFKILGQVAGLGWLEMRNWDQAVDIILRLYEKRMVLYNNYFLPQEKLEKISSLTPLGLPPADMSFECSVSSNRSILSTFASYLKGNEPSKEEILKTKGALDCIKLINFNSAVWNNKYIVTGDTLLQVISLHFPKKQTVFNFRYFEHELLFLVELMIDLMVKHDQVERVSFTLYEKVCSLYKTEGMKRATYRRLMNYRVILLSITPNLQETKLVSEEILQSNELYSKKYFESTDGFALCNNFLESCRGDTETSWKLLPLMTNKATMTYIHKHVLLQLNAQNFFDFIEMISAQGRSEIDFVVGILGGKCKIAQELTLDMFIKMLQVVISKIITPKEDTHDIFKALKENLTGDTSLLRSFSPQAVKQIKESIESVVEKNTQLQELILVLEEFK
ncbi:Arf family guanine nucleotide exchange factor GEA1 KNAG_0I00460 [Huiozyma naganishii CBS 8797]|uniref:SEC7 domain-containing protein n=1 Tax=Huiozyma naganishii (strain ATCC MYA-139 / BCRC 22969 / CBS 8797 / KCTC 17520 / NBRC 10181 / NCYC 3082 / Yp74L-3) TaxID=1071383 RepID=J7S250_HUIN7|nr:hypothetical protein KNAG_0I00460 [Kazachstania naganishii CBS 8797]CCK71837.1 hypothetical protein KNAG_0I00460 [Kazachstania naganishii CBS 8797]